MVSVTLTLAVCAGEPESLTVNISGVMLAAVLGVPLINPVDEFNVKPPVSVPDVSAHE